MAESDFGPLARRDFLKTLGLGVAGLSLPTLGLAGCGLGGGSTVGPPNFVFFLIDDMGWSDLGSYGSEFHLTPNIDALAASGMRFSQAYAASPVCSPSRPCTNAGGLSARARPPRQFPRCSVQIAAFDAVARPVIEGRILALLLLKAFRGRVHVEAGQSVGIRPHAA